MFRSHYLTLQLIAFQLLIFLSNIPVFAQQRINADNLRSKEVFQCVAAKDLTIAVNLLSDHADKPMWYAAHVATGVCSDGLCKPIDLMIYWDLLGGFAAYETPESSPLTKFDHIEFTADDHKKLREILADKNSMLKDYEAEDMVDKSVKVYSNKIDAVTGATSKTFEDVIVHGAVYTVHTLWRIVNGEVAGKILAHTRGMLNDSMIRQVFESENSKYKTFILTELPQAQLKGFTNELIVLIGDKDPYVPHFAMERLAQEIWEDQAYQDRILKHFNRVSLEVQNTILAKISDKKLSVGGMKVLIGSLVKLNNSQIQIVFRILENNLEHINDISKDLSPLLDHQEKNIAQSTSELLNKIRK